MQQILRRNMLRKSHAVYVARHSACAAPVYDDSNNMYVFNWIYAAQVYLRYLVHVACCMFDVSLVYERPKGLTCKLFSENVLILILR